MRRELVLPLERDEAWPLVSEPGELESWFADEVDIVLEPGAEGVVVVEGERREALVEEVVPQRRVVLRWCDGEGDASVVELTLDDEPDGRTRLTVLELPARTLALVGAELAALPAAPGPSLMALA